MIQRQSLLSENMLSFGRYLRRQEGYAIDAQSIIEALEGVRMIDLGNPEIFQRSLKSILCKTRKQWRDFDIHYTTYWKELNRALDSKLKHEKSKSSSSVKPKIYSINDIKSWLYQKEDINSDDNLEVSISGSHSSQDTTNIPLPDPSYKLDELVNKWYKSFHSKISRRKTSDKKKGTLDLKKIIELSSKGKEFNLAYKKAKKKEYQIVILFDASRSMSMYQSFYCSLIKSIFNIFPKTFSFAFHTEILSTDEMFQKHTLDQTIQGLEEIKGLYTSGTKIGSCLQHYIDQHSSEQVGTNTFILIISDGWDTGDPKHLADALERLKYRCRKIIWFNPLYKTESKELVKGMSVAIPFIDAISCVYSIESFSKFINSKN